MSFTPLTLKVPLEQLPHAKDLPLPAPQTAQSAGADLLAAIDEAIVLAPMERLLVPTGLRIALPPGTEGQVRPRSGLALKHGVTVLNAPGTIDADYRGEVQVLLVNLGTEPFMIERGMRIAQLIVAPYCHSHFELRPEGLDETSRGAGGFGSTGGIGGTAP